jgi:lysophospholipase L1-like esterase
MVKLAVDNASVPFIGLPTPCNFAEETLLAAYRQSLRNYAAADDIDLINFYSAMLSPTGHGIDKGLHLDGIHPNEAGYQVMAGVAADFLRYQV